MPVTLEITVNGLTDPSARYLTWTPYPAQVRVVTADVPGSVTVLLRNATGNVGGLWFRQAAPQAGATDLTLQVPVDGSPVGFLLSGDGTNASEDDGDAVLEAAVDGDVVAQVPYMVRIRKDAESLTDTERDRFLSALALLNNQGIGAFAGFHAMHVSDTNDEAHGLDAFLPWHRAYLLDLERELQAIDPAVTLPYWRFDRPAPRLFHADFIGAPAAPPSDVNPVPPRLSAANPLQNWTINGVRGLDRHPRFADPRVSPAMDLPGQPVWDGDWLAQEATRVGLDYAYRDMPNPRDDDLGFKDYLENNPHGSAHVSFSGRIRRPATAAGDPLFFLLHCNVDRIWAQWQQLADRYDGTQPDTYFYRGAAGSAGATRIGHNLLDTMWPWNNVTASPRPTTAPRHPLRASLVVASPPDAPRVGDLIDYQGRNGAPPCGFDYDNVPYHQEN